MERERERGREKERETSPCFQAAPPPLHPGSGWEQAVLFIVGASVRRGGCQQVAMATTLLSLATFSALKGTVENWRGPHHRPN